MRTVIAPLRPEVQQDCVCSTRRRAEIARRYIRRLALEPDLGARATTLRIDEAVCAATTMAVEMTSRDPAQWTDVERAREERARAIRIRQDRAKTPEERLEETLRLSKLMSELQQGAAGDVPSR